MPVADKSNLVNVQSTSAGLLCLAILFWSTNNLQIFYVFICKNKWRTANGLGGSGMTWKNDIWQKQYRSMELRFQSAMLIVLLTSTLTFPNNRRGRRYYLRCKLIAV